MSAMRDDRRAREAQAEIQGQAERIEQLTVQVAELTERCNRAEALLRRTIDITISWVAWDIDQYQQAERLRLDIAKFLASTR